MKVISKLDDKLGVYFSYKSYNDGVYKELKAMDDSDGCWDVKISGDSYFNFSNNKSPLKDMMESYRELFVTFIDTVKPNCFSFPVPPETEGEAINFNGYSGEQDGNFVIYTKEI